jgi:spermidine/putrescine transport system permease protein
VSATSQTTTHPARRRRRRVRLPRGLLTLPPALYVVLLLLGPIVLIALYSFNLRAQYPGVPTAFSTHNWNDFLRGHDNVFRARFIYSMKVTLLVSVGTVLAAYPLAYYLAFVARKRRYTYLLLVLAPFFTSYLLRIIAWRIILGNNGVVDWVLWHLHLVDQGHSPSWLIYSSFSVGLVLFYTWVPFVALPIFVVLENMDRRVLEAAQDLGANGFTAFWRVTFPLSFSGVMAGFVFVLIPTTGEFIAPLLVGGPDNYLFGNAVQSLFASTADWNYGSVLALWLVAVVVVLMVVFGRYLSTDVQERGAT